MKAKLLDKSFRYRSAEESRGPGYLERRFAAIRRKQREEAEQSQPSNVLLGKWLLKGAK